VELLTGTDAFLAYLGPFAEKAKRDRLNQRAEFAPNGDEALADLVAAADKLNGEGHRVWVVSHNDQLWADLLASGGSNAGWYGRYHRIHTQP
jgi:hypothetical protein